MQANAEKLKYYEAVVHAVAAHPPFTKSITHEPVVKSNLYLGESHYLHYTFPDSLSYLQLLQLDPQGKHCLTYLTSPKVVAPVHIITVS